MVGALSAKGAKRAKQGQTSERVVRSQLSKSLMATNETQSTNKDNWGRGDLTCLFISRSRS